MTSLELDLCACRGDWVKDQLISKVFELLALNLYKELFAVTHIIFNDIVFPLSNIGLNLINR